MSDARGLRSEDPSDVRARTVLQAQWRLYLHSPYSDDILQFKVEQITIPPINQILITVFCNHIQFLGYLIVSVNGK